MTTPIPAVSTPTPAANDSSSSGSSDGMSTLLDPSTFLNLLVDELKYQNPLDPTSSAAFMSQIAELSQVEQLETVSSSSQMTSATELIGQTITGTDPSGNLITGAVSGVTMTSTGPLLDVGDDSVDLSSVQQVTSTPTSSTT